MTDKIESTAANSTRPKTVIERTYRAGVEELWELWTTKEGFESWWGPDGTRVEVHAIEPRSGGALYYDMIADTPETIEATKQLGLLPRQANRCTFAEFTPYESLTLTHVMDFFPGVKPYESTIVVEFFPAGDFVRMATTIYPMHNEECTRLSIEGFTFQLTKLDKRFGFIDRQVVATTRPCFPRDR
jgi:uncharacterized protein YndB with AHSA1/START domain